MMIYFWIYCVCAGLVFGVGWPMLVDDERHEHFDPCCPHSLWEVIALVAVSAGWGIVLLVFIINAIVRIPQVGIERAVQ